jgi:prepilin-type N-terminal cleavage/methylation domain-containing protein
MRDEDGFTLPELMIGMVIMSLLIVAIAGALIVSLKTTGSTEQRLHESQDVLITSSYLANDVQSASDVNVSGATNNCSAAFTTLVTFTYASSAHPTAVYKCGTASNGETQVTRTFNGGSPIVIAHFAGTARPTATVAYDGSTPPVPMSVTMRFTKPSDCTLDCTYTLFGSRRSYNPASVTTGGNPLPGDVVLMSTGSASPLWVQGTCPDPGTTTGCIVDTTKTALPISDVATTDWTPTPASPATLWDKLRDGDDTTYIQNAPGKRTIARVALSSVDPPDSGVLPVVELRASKINGSNLRMTLSLYDGNNATPLVTSAQFGPINSNFPAGKNFDWFLTQTEASLIPTAAYAHLTVGISVSNASGTDAAAVHGVALDTLDFNAQGLLTIKGPLYVNSQLSNAVRLTGKKAGGNQITILDSGSNTGDFKIWSPGACSGCNHNTVSCASCAWVGQQPWTSYSTSIPDPLRSLPGPDPATLGTGNCNGAGVCSPGVYASTFSQTANTSLQPGIYYFQQGMSITGNAVLTCPAPCSGGVMIYIAGGSVSFAGNSGVNLPAPTTGTYKGIVMFQARSDTNALKFAGNTGSGTTNVLGGIVYVPSATQVTLATGSAALTAKAIVAQNIKVSSSVTIG